MSDPINNFQWWQDALDGRHAPINVNMPQSGYYKTRRRGREGFVPCSFWYDEKNGDLRCHMDGADFDLQRALEIWPFASKNPVSFEDYGARLRDGKWPGESEAVIGHNASPPDDTPEAIADRIDDLARKAEELIKAGAAPNDDVSDQASDLANTFGELEAKADKLRAAEKEPHLEAGRVVDRKWARLRDRAADLKKRLKLAVVTPWLRKKSDDAQKANVAAITSGAAPETLPQPRLTAGSSKRSTGLRTQKSAEISDWPALLGALSEHPAIRETAQRIADASAKAGVTLPGMKIIEIKVAA